MGFVAYLAIAYFQRVLYHGHACEIALKEVTTRGDEQCFSEMVTKANAMIPHNRRLSIRAFNLSSCSHVCSCSIFLRGMTASSAFTPCCAVTDQKSEPISDFAAPPAVSFLALLARQLSPCRSFPDQGGAPSTLGTSKFWRAKLRPTANCRTTNLGASPVPHLTSWQRTLSSGEGLRVSVSGQKRKDGTTS